MQSDLAGRIRNTRLPVSSALLPLFEAVVNSNDSIRDSAKSDGRIEITIARGPSLLAPIDDDGAPTVFGFTIADNGVGFTSANFDSFSMLDSLAKELIGGKGVGRLVWLVAFEDVLIESHYEEAGEWWDRSFKFRRTASGIEEMSLLQSQRGDGARTVVHLRGFKDPFQSAAPKSARAIAKRLIEHCLVSFMLDDVPAITIQDAAEPKPLDVNALYQAEYAQQAASRKFAVAGHEFEIVDVLLRPSAESEHAVHYCANKRSVVTSKISGTIAHMDDPLVFGDDRLLYAGCVTGGFLDAHVNPQRTGFDVHQDGELAVGTSDVSWNDITKATKEAIGSFLAPQLQAMKDQSLDRITKFVQDEEPRYRVLLSQRPESLAEIPGNLSDERLELELHKRLATLRHDVKVEAAKRLKTVPAEGEDFATYQRDVIRTLGELQEVAKADLAEYVVHRRTVLDFFERLLSVSDDGKTAREDALHGLFFPMRKNSDEVDYEAHNLWVIDEGLAFHHYLTSDIPISGGSKRGAPKAKRPDLLIYNRRMAFTGENSRPFGSVVLVEFKRPERKDFDADENPVTQVYDYIRDIREGRAKNDDGSSVDLVPDTIPFFCHVIATMSPSLRKQLVNLDFIAGPDQQTFFKFNSPLRAYVEVSSYSHVLQEAVKRNKAFFDKLCLPTGLKRI